MIFNLGKGGGAGGGIRYDAATDMIQIKDANGVWHDWKSGGLLTYYLYKDGDDCDDITGGYYGTFVKGNTSNPSQTNEFTKNLTDMYIRAQGSTTDSVYSEPITRVKNTSVLDLSAYSKIKFNVTFEIRRNVSGGSSTSHLDMGILDGSNNFQVVTSKYGISGAKISDTLTFEADITNITSGYVGIEAHGKDYGNVLCTVHRIWLE